MRFSIERDVLLHLTTKACGTIRGKKGRLGLEVTDSRVKQNYAEAHHCLRDFAAHGPKAICLLPGRAGWLLEYCGYQSWAEVRTAMETGELQLTLSGAGVLWQKTMLPSVGHKTLSALYDWTGRPTLPLPSKPSFSRPPNSN